MDDVVDEIDPRLAAWIDATPAEDLQWGVLHAGPAVDAVAARLASVPRAFLDEGVSLVALASDAGLAGLLAVRFAADERVRRGAAIGIWLHASEELVEPFSPPLTRDGTPSPVDLRGVDALALRLAPVVDPLDWLSDDERRAEASRLFLLWSGLLPAGEDAQTARAQWDERDSLRRNAALAEAFAEQRHRAEVARALAAARAREAAARYSSE
ncbi:phosphohydrolase [Microbacterium sp. bgisy203]|uniref:phosphohydrolase n=1 Tax=Microbacterium sp. bgisy203 TaxID=3413799 RepID=UPI003D719484